MPSKDQQQIEFLINIIDGKLIELSKIFNRHSDSQSRLPYLKELNDLLDSRLELSAELTKLQTNPASV